MQWQQQQSSLQADTVNPGAGAIHMPEINNSGSPYRGKFKNQLFPPAGLQGQPHAATTAVSHTPCGLHRAALVFVTSKASRAQPVHF